MIEPDPETGAGLSLTCPVCGEVLSGTPDSADRVECSANHQFSLISLLFAQSTRASALIDLGTRLLQEQEQLFRSIARQLWQGQSLAAIRLEGQADRLQETTDAIRGLLSGGEVELQPLREFGGSAN